MTSDSEESDYEDASQHHDNQEVENIIANVVDNNYNIELVQEDHVEGLNFEGVNREGEEADDLAAGINARIIVQHVIDNLWPIIENNDGEQNNHGDGLDNLQDGYFVEENHNFVDSDDDDTVSFHSETDEPDLYHRSEFTLTLCY